MSEQPQQIPAKRRCWPRRVLVVVLLFAALYSGYRYTLHRMIEAKLDGIRQQGYPVTLAELDKWYPQVPAGENAADIYLQAFAKFNKWNTNSLVLKRDSLPIIGNAKLPPRTQALSNEVRSLIAEYLAANTESLRLLHQGASMRRCRYPVDLTSGFEAPLLHLNDVRQGARLLALKGILRSEEGTGEAASEAIIDGLCLARSLEQEPTLISQLVRVACQGIALTDLERMLNRTAASDSELSQLATSVSDAEDSQTMIRGVVGEGLNGDSVFRMSVRELTKWGCQGWLPVALGTTNRYVVAPAIGLYRATGFIELDHLNFLSSTEYYIGVCQKPSPALLAFSKSFDNRRRNHSRWRLFSGMFLPTYGVFRNSAEGSARLGTARIALAIERYRLAQGGLPDSLGDLIPTSLDAVPTDPFDGQPLRYKKLANGYVVYSVGENGKDDGGDETISERTNWKPKDITFTVER
jgi:hypothetical protein